MDEKQQYTAEEEMKANGSVYIKDVDKVKLLEALWKNKPLAKFYLNNPNIHAPKWNSQDAAMAVEKGMIDHFKGRLIMCDLSGDYVDSTQYNHFSHFCTFERVLITLKAGRMIDYSVRAMIPLNLVSATYWNKLDVRYYKNMVKDELMTDCKSFDDDEKRVLDLISSKDPKKDEELKKLSDSLMELFYGISMDSSVCTEHIAHIDEFLTDLEKKQCKLTLMFPNEDPEKEGETKDLEISKEEIEILTTLRQTLLNLDNVLFLRRKVLSEAIRLLEIENIKQIHRHIDETEEKQTKEPVKIDK